MVHTDEYLDAFTGMALDEERIRRIGARVLHQHLHEGKRRAS